jgi:predicted RNA-binding protein with RPS1 domain
LVHISELSHDYVKHPSEVAKVGDEVEVQVLGFSKRKRRIDLSMKALMEKPEPKSRGRGGRSSRSQDIDLSQFEDEPEELPTAMELALRKAMGGDSVEDILDEEEQATQKEGKRGKGGKNQDEQEELLNRTLQLQD